MPIVRHIVMRDASKNDGKQIKDLFDSNFGSIASQNNAMQDYDSRYMVAELHTQTTNGLKFTPKIIGITGISTDENGNHNLDWSCMDSEHSRYVDVLEELVKCCGRKVAPEGIKMLGIDSRKIADNADVAYGKLLDCATLGITSVKGFDKPSDRTAKDKLFKMRDSENNDFADNLEDSTRICVPQYAD